MPSSKFSFALSCYNIAFDNSICSLHSSDPLQNLCYGVGQILYDDLDVYMLRYYFIRLHQVPT